jgi:hypothetical protein
LASLVNRLSVRLLAPLAADLKGLQLRRGRPSSDPLLFARPDGGAWRTTDWKNWRRRVFDAACAGIGLSAVCPYHHRHSFVSLLYGHVFDELDHTGERRSAEALIRAARLGSRSAIG